jgi:predicted acylesterase/phospholipase RssA
MEWITEADGVFRGGGVKGLALAGALCGFAEHPTRPIKTWKNVAGASAGAIIACYLATGHNADQMLELMKKTNFNSFADFPLHNKMLGGVNLVVEHGMAPGDAFEHWFDEVLEGATFASVRKPDQTGGSPEWWLKLIAVDVTNKQLLVLPDDLINYKQPRGSTLIDPDTFKISRAARMSMSIPYFFKPVELEHKEGHTALIIDGGTLSNFPVWLFDVDPTVTGHPPTRPTFGFTLKGGHGIGGGLNALGRFAPWGARFAFDPHRPGSLGCPLRLPLHPCAHARCRRCRRRDHRVQPLDRQAGSADQERPRGSTDLPRRVPPGGLHEHLPRRVSAHRDSQPRQPTRPRPAR